MDFREEAKKEFENNLLIQTWMRNRAKHILDSVAVTDILDHFGTHVETHNRATQIPCPFHGKDNKPSARIYKGSETKAPHIWCFVCQEQWNAIDLWKKYRGTDISFSQILFEIERAFHIQTPPKPQTIEIEKPDEELERYTRLMNACESRLTMYKNCFPVADYLKLCVMLDRLQHRVNTKAILYKDATPVFEKIAQKIAERVRGPKLCQGK